MRSKRIILKSDKSQLKGSPLKRWLGRLGDGVPDFAFPEPIAPVKAEVGCDEASRALVLVIGQIVGEASREIPPTLTTGEILDRAESAGMLDVIVGFAKEPDKALGWRLKNLLGRPFVDSKGRAFNFDSRELEAGAKYPITFLEDNSTN